MTTMLTPPAVLPEPTAHADQAQHTLTVNMRPDKVCKNSIRYAASDKTCPAPSIYLGHGFAAQCGGQMPAMIQVQITRVL